LGQISVPDVEQHDGAEPRADADPRIALLQRECADEVRPEQRRAGEPRHDRGPAEIQQRARGDVPGDARRGVIRCRRLERGNLDEIEVVEQADPHDAGQKVKPSRDNRYEFHILLPPVTSGRF
jgi:hypothetical protein